MNRSVAEQLPRGVRVRAVLSVSIALRISAVSGIVRRGSLRVRIVLVFRLFLRVVAGRFEIDGAVVGDVAAEAAVPRFARCLHRDGVVTERQQALFPEGDEQRHDQQNRQRSEAPLLPHDLSLPFT